MLDLYMGLSARQVERALERMLAAGDIELALRMSVAAENRYPDARAIRELKNQAADRLRARAQYVDPFGFIAYSELAGREHGMISAQQPTESSVARRSLD
jgi:hypothetical protein